MKAIIRVAGLFVLVTVGVFAIAVQSASAEPAVVEADPAFGTCEVVGTCGMVPVDEGIIDAIIDAGADGNGDDDPPAEDEISDGGADGNGDDDPPADDPPADDPPADDPPADDPPADDPPADDPPADDPPADDPPADDPPADDSEECEDCESETEGSTLPEAGTGAAVSEDDDDSNMAIFALAGLGVAAVAAVLGLVLMGRRRNSGVL